MRYAKLRGKIREVYGTQEAFAEAMGLSKGALSMRLNGKTRWTLGEANKAVLLLGIDHAEIGAYFFCFES